MTPPGVKGQPIWELVAEYLRGRRTVRIVTPSTPRIHGVAGNAGYAGPV